MPEENQNPSGKPPLAPRRYVTFRDPVTDALRAESEALRNTANQLDSQLQAQRQLTRAMQARNDAKDLLIQELQRKINWLEHQKKVEAAAKVPSPPPNLFKYQSPKSLRPA